MARLRLDYALLPLLALGLMPYAASAQTLGYGSVDGGSSGASSGASRRSAAASEDVGDEEEEFSGRASASPRRDGNRRYFRTRITPYIEAAQIAEQQLEPGNDLLTWSSLAAGVDIAASRPNVEGVMSVRYERRFGLNSTAEDSDTLYGIGRGEFRIAPNVRIEAGGLATHVNVEDTGVPITGVVGNRDRVTQVYSVYGGPAITSNVGAVGVEASYRAGFTATDSPDAPRLVGQPALVDVFDQSISHTASIHAGVKPGEVLPVGIGVGGNYYREDISNLDQRVEDLKARVDVTLPVSPTIALVGGVGYEDVEISNRDAVRGPDGIAITGPDGRWVTDKSRDRVLSYDTSGFIWDAGVVWRPSRRTALEAHVGRRYGSTSVYGSFAYSPDSRSSINISAYDNMAGFGGQLNRAVAMLPTQFEILRNPLSGDLGECVNSLEQGNCLTSALGNVSSSTFRGRGVMANYNVSLGKITAGIGAGYDRRRFIGAKGTILELADGVVDESWWLRGQLDARVSDRGRWLTLVAANWFQSGLATNGDSMVLKATTAYAHSITDHLSATAALGLDGANFDDPLVDDWAGSALVGVRYSF